MGTGIRMIQMIDTSGPGGAENTVVNLSSYLEETDYEPLVCLFEDGWLADRLREKRVETVVIRQGNGLDRRWIKNLLRLIKSRGIRLIHAHEFTSNAYATILSLFSGVPAVTTVHGKNYYQERLHRRMVYRISSEMTQMVAVSDDVKRFLSDVVAIRSSRVTTIRNGIEIGRFEPNSAIRRQCRRELGITGEQVVVGAIGNLYDVKGHRYLVEAARKVCRRHPNALFMVAGRGYLQSELEKQIVSLGLSEKVRLLGFRDDVDRLLQAFDVYVMPSITEGLPLALLEAMAAARPVIASEVGGIPEVIVDGLNGVLVKPANSEELSDRLIALLGNPLLMEALGRNGYNTSRKYSIQAMGAAYTNLYDQARDRTMRKRGFVWNR